MSQRTASVRELDLENAARFLASRGALPDALADVKVLTDGVLGVMLLVTRAGRSLAEDDWQGWKAITDRLGQRIDLVGDGLFVTTASRLDRGIAEGVANSVLVKVNKHGLVSSAHAVLQDARAAGYRTVVSARSGTPKTRGSSISLSDGGRARPRSVSHTGRNTLQNESTARTRGHQKHGVLGVRTANEMRQIPW